MHIHIYNDYAKPYFAETKIKVITHDKKKAEKLF